MKYQINGKGCLCEEASSQVLPDQHLHNAYSNTKAHFFLFFTCAKFNSVPYGRDSSVILSLLETENQGVKKSVRDFGKLTYLHILNFLKETSLYCPLITGPEAKFLLLCRYCICQHLLTHNSTITLTSRPLIQLFNNHIFKE